MDCKTCDIPDVNCYEQCKEDRCIGCFGAEFNDCFECPNYNEDEREEECQTQY